MNEQTLDQGVPQQANFPKNLKKLLICPILFLVLYVGFRYNVLWQEIRLFAKITQFGKYGFLPVIIRILELFRAILPLVIVALLILHQYGKLKNVRRLIAILYLVFAAASLYRFIRFNEFNFHRFPRVSAKAQREFLLAFARELLVGVVVPVALSIVLLLKKNKFAAVRILCLATIVLEMVACMLGKCSLLSVLVVALGMMGIYYLPDALVEPDAVMVSGQKVKRWLKIGCVGLVIYIVMNIATTCAASDGTKVSGNHDCYVCGEQAGYKYGSHYYCTVHYWMVKTVVDNS